jgi:hypothetical protein
MPPEDLSAATSQQRFGRYPNRSAINDGHWLSAAFSGRSQQITGQTDIERRSVLRTITAASGAALTSAVLSRHAAAQPTSKQKPSALGHFETAETKVGDSSIFIRRYGKGSPDQPDVALRGAAMQRPGEENRLD